MPFLSFLPAIKYFGHFQNPDTLAVDIYLLSAVDFAMGIGRCVNDDLLNELIQDTRCQLRDTALYVLDDPIAAEILVLDGRQNAGIQQPPRFNRASIPRLFSRYTAYFEVLILSAAFLQSATPAFPSSRTPAEQAY